MNAKLAALAKQVIEAARTQSNVPAEHREKENWRYVATKLDEAARGASVVEAFAVLRTVLTMEGFAYRPQ